MQARFKGSPLYLVLTLTPLFMLTVNIVWTMNYTQHPGGFRMVFWKASVYFQSGTLMNVVLTAVETLYFIWEKNMESVQIGKTASCCKSSWGSKCWTYHYVWSDLAQVSPLWRGPIVILNSSEGAKCWIGFLEVPVQICPMVTQGAIKLEQSLFFYYV